MNASEQFQFFLFELLVAIWNPIWILGSVGANLVCGLDRLNQLASKYPVLLLFSKSSARPCLVDFCCCAVCWC